MNVTPAQLDALMFLADLQNDDAVRIQMANLKSIEATPTHTELHTHQLVPRTSLPDGPAPVAVAVTDTAGRIVGELLLWIRDGFIDNVEQPWFGDSPPTTLPDRHQVRAYN